MRRVLIAAACGSLLALVGTGAPSLAADCSTAQKAMKGTLEVIPSEPAVNEETDFLATILDNRQVVEGSRRITVTGPNGSTTYNPELTKFTPTKAGRYLAEYKQDVYSCYDPEPHTVTDTAGPRAFNVTGGQAAGANFKGFQSGGRPGTAALFGYVECPDATIASGEALTYTIYYELGAKLPTRSSPHLGTTDASGCVGGGRAPTRVKKGRRFTARVEQGTMSIEVYGPAKARVLMELTSNGRVLAATRAIFRSSRKTETVKRDRAHCTAASGGCGRFSIERG